jgi:urease accessory protein
MQKTDSSPHGAARCLAALAAVTIAGANAMAHTGEGVVGGFVSGFTHPIFGPDHVVAMVAVGLWGGMLGRPAVWLLPVAFPLVMACGGALGTRGVPLPGVEIGIAASGIVLGGVVAVAAKPPFWLAALIVGAFAVFHGHAHGTELPGAADPLAYAAGFVVCTGLLHLTGIGVGMLIHWKPAGPIIVRSCGGVIAGIGCYYLMQA